MNEKEANEIKEYYKLSKILHPAWMIILFCGLVWLAWYLIAYGRAPFDPSETVAIKIISETFLIMIFAAGLLIFLKLPAWNREAKLRMILRYVEYLEPHKTYEGSTLFNYYFQHLEKKWKFPSGFEDELKQLVREAEEKLNEK